MGKHEDVHYPVSILCKHIASRYRPVRVADGPITARYRFIKNASWVQTRTFNHFYCCFITAEVFSNVYCLKCFKMINIKINCYHNVNLITLNNMSLDKWDKFYSQKAYWPMSFTQEKSSTMQTWHENDIQKGHSGIHINCTNVTHIRVCIVILYINPRFLWRKKAFWYLLTGGFSQRPQINKKALNSQRRLGLSIVVLSSVSTLLSFFYSPLVI